ncbi:dihydrofolate reductase-like domain-containing protein [Polychytrium aggregatum]|uniref:dihydrofolate reductase-like domain-containing protein n=1 Tax=Polychytrium aggregatum TaxID=110093 RepID=UPI0022FDBA65|nr:dihydrofolate reductase-like domain-containing protein [Polychytrium aggregatum]KAI9207223.1 dihydrofolate reductase-like domain-containing protein [Polychytrium aggregatum]
MLELSLVVAAEKSTLGIGVDNRLPWRLPSDMKHFLALTTGGYGSAVAPGPRSADSLDNVVVMGRRTWESIPARFRPLTARLNVVLSSDPEFQSKTELPPQVHVSGSFDSALEYIESLGIYRNVWIIGGSSVYAAALSHPQCARIFLTQVTPLGQAIRFDTFFPAIPEDRLRLASDDEFSLAAPGAPQTPITENGFEFAYKLYVRI